MIKFKLLISFLIINLGVMAQEQELPYYELEDPTEDYTAGSVAARMIDALGFRYYWASEGLRDVDLEYKASESGRTSAETNEHIFGLSQFILNSISKDAKKSTKEILSFEEQRKQTLFNLKKTSDILRETKNISQYDSSRLPFWNIINGPISDAIWHCGQLVMMRRASGNPFNSKVGLLSGKVRE
ncbi:hypothetical protein [Algibacter sp. L4_22]|uniref:hypothetical protein n=1 Tax=Algibacter sp. L4_22 TaxID=2942477 RepID=UPI00201B5D4B|nr:hypothetical protein [Algibacter sp. L4_22]MCL5128773.1 hypothetical protein [Algibacter sp. L4_22]